MKGSVHTKETVRFVSILNFELLPRIKMSFLTCLAGFEELKILVLGKMGSGTEFELKKVTGINYLIKEFLLIVSVLNFDLLPGMVDNRHDRQTQPYNQHKK